MPFCKVLISENESREGNEIKIFYNTYGHGSIKVLLITGLAGTHDTWGPQLLGLVGIEIPNLESESVPTDDDQESSFGLNRIEVCTFDNRGMGQSSVPLKKTDYTTTIMAKDAMALMDHLGWKKAHVFGISMGSMIACKLAAMVPERIMSLAVISGMGGGYECIPPIGFQTLSIVTRFLLAKTPEKRAHVDLDIHYTSKYLNELVIGPDQKKVQRRTILHQQYVKGITSSGMQLKHGFDGQLNACWMHSMTPEEYEAIRSGGFFVSVIHGRYDVIAQICHARKMVEKMQPHARMVDLYGGHLVSHERTREVNEALLEMIMASRLNLSVQKWARTWNEVGSDLETD